MSKESTPLFRKRVVNQSGATLFGGTVVRTGRLATSLALGAIACVFGLVLVLVLGTYERKERVPGYIAPTTGLVRVTSFRAGVIKELKIVEGETVDEGQPLLAISSVRGTSEGVDADVAQVTGLESERANIESRIDREADLAKAREQAARRGIKALQRQLDNLEQRRMLAVERTNLLRQDVERLESLRATGHVSDSLMDDKQGELLEARQDAATYSYELERILAAIGALEAELEQIPLESGARQDELHARRLEVQRMLTEAEVQREGIIRAPVSGQVTTVLAYPGLSVTPNQTMLAILPEDSGLQAELLVPTHAAGFVQSGQQVRLRYDAFPHQKFGVYAGSVRLVSRTVLNPEDQAGPVRLQTPAYRVIVDLDANSVIAYGEEIPLRPGLTLQADVIRERMRLIEWIFDPVRAALSGL